MKQLIKKLKIVDGIHTSSRRVSHHVYFAKGIENGEIKIISVNDKLYDKEKLSKTSYWSTYEACYEYLFYLEKNTLVSKAYIYYGDMLNGLPTHLKFEVCLHLPIEYISNIESEINWKFREYLSDRYDEYLDAQKKKWMNDYAKTILIRAETE